MKPMMWGYMAQVGRYFPEVFYEKYGRVFGSIWVASAYKGAQGELATITKMEERLSNHLTWLQVMKVKSSQSIVQFDGIALTGWSRYDHFLALCELLPQAIPQLASSLHLLKLGRNLQEADKTDIQNKLGCSYVYILFYFIKY